MRELKRYFSYIGNKKYIYWFILILTIITENVLNILYSYVNKQTLNSIEYANMQLFKNAVILCAIVLVLRCLFPFLRYFSIRLVRKMVFELKISVFNKLLKFNMLWYENNHSGDAIKTLNWDANSLKDSWFSHVYWVLGKITIGVSSLITMFIYSQLLAIISVIVCASTAAISIFLNNSMKESSKKVQVATVNLAKQLNDILSGFLILKIYSGSKIVIDKFIENNNNVTAKEMERTKKASALEMLSFLLGLIGSFSTILVGIYFVSNSMLDYGTVMAVVTLQISLGQTMQRLGSSIATFNNSLVKASRVFDFLELDCDENTFQKNIWNKDNNNAEISNKTIPEIKPNAYSINIQNLTFAYDNNIKVFDNFNLDIKPNEKIMLKGKSGCGKSTLLKLLLRFYDYNQGCIKINNIDLKNYSIEKIRHIIAYIPQDCYLFEGTIAENIACGMSYEMNCEMTKNNILDADINKPNLYKSDIINAAKLAYADEFISQLPYGYETRIKSGGTNLSGGQRQRIAIARAFLKNAPILLMDEPSSALDTESEKMVHKALHKLMEDKLVIMVSHRDMGEVDFDRIVDM